MLSFKSFAVFATLAFGAISSVAAGPTPVARADVVTHSPVYSDVTARDGACGVAAILVEVKANISPAIVKLNACTQAEATIEVLTPIVADIRLHLADAIVKLHALVGLSADVILADVNGGARITVDALAYLVADLLCFVFSALSVVLGLGGSILIPLLCTVGELLCGLVVIVISLCGGLLVGLCAQIGAHITAVAHVIVALNINVLVSLFAIV